MAKKGARPRRRRITLGYLEQGQRERGRGAVLAQHVPQKILQFRVGTQRCGGKTGGCRIARITENFPPPNLASNGPYFHDNSAATIEEVVAYFNSPAYNQSQDGRRYPIRLNEHQTKDLVAFLRAL